MNLFALADKKRTTIKGISDLTMDEYQYWVAFYELQYEETRNK